MAMDKEATKRVKKTSVQSKLSNDSVLSEEKANANKTKISSNAKAANPKKSRTAAARRKQPKAKGESDIKSKATEVTTEMTKQATAGVGRKERIAVAAYYIAQKRGFHATDPVQNWLEAEKEIQAAELL